MQSSLAIANPPPGHIHAKEIKLQHAIWDSGKVSFVRLSKTFFMPLTVRAARKSEHQDNIKKSKAKPRSQKSKYTVISSAPIPEVLEGTSNMISLKSQSEIIEHSDSARTGSTNAIEKDVRPSLGTVDRNTVLRACLLTSGGLAACGVLIRQGSHWLFQMSWFSSDCTTLMPYDFQLWHIGASAAAVMGVTVSRQVLLKSWPAFYRSSQAANHKILKSLEPLDYVLVSALPGMSEELLFRGSMLPLFGLDWKGIVLSGIIFGALHLTGGRNKAFAIWASFIGILYGSLAAWTSDLLVPMATHSLANLAAAVIWKQKEDATCSEQY